MRVIEPSATIERCPPYEDALLLIERAARTAYKSEDRGGTVETAERLIRRLIHRGPTDREPPHESTIEHVSVTVRFVVDRGVSHELVRHRLASYTQESSRYVSYAKEKHGGEITVIRPCFWPEGSALASVWEYACVTAEGVYLTLCRNGATPEQARSVLPNSTKTEVVMSANLREWRHVFKMRCAASAHPQMRQVMVPLLAEFRARLGVFFEDLTGE